MAKYTKSKIRLTKTGEKTEGIHCGYPQPETLEIPANTTYTLCYAHYPHVEWCENVFHR